MRLRRSSLACCTAAWLASAPVAAQTLPSAPRPALPLSTEPAIAEVVRMALSAARTLGPERVHELARRARLRGLVPHVKFSAERGLNQDLSATSTAQTDRRNTVVGDDLSVGATLTFELDRLVFTPEEVRLVAIERWLASDLRKLTSDVVRLYFQRRRLVREQASGLAPDPELAEQILETEALLDALTAGAFSKALAAASSGR